MRFLYIEEEVDHIAVFHDVFLALGAQEAFFFGCGERTADFHEFIVSDGLRADKAFLKVCVNLARCLRRFSAAAYCPNRIPRCRAPQGTSRVRPLPVPPSPLRFPRR